MLLFLYCEEHDSREVETTRLLLGGTVLNGLFGIFLHQLSVVKAVAFVGGKIKVLSSVADIIAGCDQMTSGGQPDTTSPVTCSPLWHK